MSGYPFSVFGFSNAEDIGPYATGAADSGNHGPQAEGSGVVTEALWTLAALDVMIESIAPVGTGSELHTEQDPQASTVEVDQGSTPWDVLFESLKTQTPSLVPSSEDSSPDLEYLQTPELRDPEQFCTSGEYIPETGEKSEGAKEPEGGASPSEAFPEGVAIHPAPSGPGSAANPPPPPGQPPFGQAAFPLQPFPFVPPPMQQPSPMVTHPDAPDFPHRLDALITVKGDDENLVRVCTMVSCPQCTAVFPADELAVHYQSHFEGERIRCNWPRCNSRGTHKRGLSGFLRHVEDVHLHIRTLHCPHCHLTRRTDAPQGGHPRSALDCRHREDALSHRGTARHMVCGDSFCQGLRTPDRLPQVDMSRKGRARIVGPVVR